MKAKIPAFLCFVAGLHSCWMIHGANAGRLVYNTYTVEITVHGPDGKIIPAIRHR